MHILRCKEEYAYKDIYKTKMHKSRHREHDAYNKKQMQICKMLHCIDKSFQNLESVYIKKGLEGNAME